MITEDCSFVQWSAAAFFSNQRFNFFKIYIILVASDFQVLSEYELIWNEKKNEKNTLRGSIGNRVIYQCSHRHLGRRHVDRSGTSGAWKHDWLMLLIKFPLTPNLVSLPDSPWTGPFRFVWWLSRTVAKSRSCGDRRVSRAENCNFEKKTKFLLWFLLQSEKKMAGSPVAASVCDSSCCTAFHGIRS